MTAWVVLLHDSRLGFARLERCACNAFNDPPLCSLSPTDEAVRAFVAALVADLGARSDVEAEDLETPGLPPCVHGSHHKVQLVALNGWLTTLLGLSFAEADTEGATAPGTDARGLRAHVAERIDVYLAVPLDAAPDLAAEWLVVDLAGDPAELGPYVRWKASSVTALVAEIRAALHPEVALDVIPTVQRSIVASCREGTDLRGLCMAADFPEVPFYEPGPGRVAVDRLDVAQRAGFGTTGAILRPDRSDMRGAGVIRSHVAAVEGNDLMGLSFYDWGMLRVPDRAALREALA